jgi:hypothetical protein
MIWRLMMRSEARIPCPLAKIILCEIGFLQSQKRNDPLADTILRFT